MKKGHYFITTENKQLHDQLVNLPDLLWANKPLSSLNGNSVDLCSTNGNREIVHKICTRLISVETSLEIGFSIICTAMVITKLLQIH